jgi:hypothetical protein
MIALKVISIMLFGVILFLAPLSHAGTVELTFKTSLKSLSDDKIKLLNVLFENIFRSWQGDHSEFSLENFETLSADLNGDGEDEFLVFFGHTTLFCGTARPCDASIYQKTGNGWQYIGSAGDGTSSIFIDDETYLGWRVLHDEYWRYCWTQTPGSGASDMYGFPFEKGTPGYFMSARPGQSCANADGKE